MIHPLKAATSFECDGCGHHASFHRMDNHMDEETVRRWKTQDTIRDQEHRRITGMVDIVEEVVEIVAPKRRRIENKITGEHSAAEDAAVIPRGDISRSKRRANGP